MEIGLIDRLCEPDELFQSAMAYAEEICATLLLAARAGVEAITRSRNAQLLAAMEHEWSRQKSLWGTVEFKRAVSDLVKSKGPSKVATLVSR